MVDHPSSHRLIVGITGASGAILEIRLLAALKSISDDMINDTVGRVLARLRIQNDLVHEWQGQSSE